MYIPKNMGWDERTYHFYLIFGDKIAGKEPWLEEQWMKTIDPLFYDIIELSPNRFDTSLRVLEFTKKDEQYRYHTEEYKMGKLRRNEESHKRWTLKENDARFFAHFESWTPFRTVCERYNFSPDVYISVANEEGIYASRQFDILVTIAVSDDIKDVQPNMILALSKVFNSKRTVYNERKWGEGKKDEDGRWIFRNNIMETNSLGIYKDEAIIDLNIHSIDFDKIVFEPYWRIII
jgi:hypothetical protein